MVERFRNGDDANDPVKMRPWTSEWYSPSPWEGEDGSTFYDSFVFDRHYGGDLQGLREKLPYLKELGVNALYLNPIFQAESHHKYDATDYRHVDEHFGAGRGDFDRTTALEELGDATTWTWSESDTVFLDTLKAAKKLGFRVILDGVFNHVGTRHPAFQDVKERGVESPYADWFSVRSWDPFECDGWAGFDELPAFRKSPEHGLASKSLRDHIFDVTRRWMDPNGDGDPSDGIDGWRLDVPEEIPQSFWVEWCELVRSINPQAYIVGEIWKPAPDWLDGQTFDAVMNYPFAEAALSWIAHDDMKISATELDRRLGELRDTYPSEVTYALQNLADSHDTDRLVSKVFNPDRAFDEGNREQADSTYDGSKPSDLSYRRARLFALLQMTYVGAPMIYYGDEAGMWGSDDPNNRKPMLWKDLEPYVDSDQNQVIDAHLEFYRSAIALRRAHAALRVGGFRTLITDDSQDLWVFVREDAEEEILVALNASESDAQFDLPGEGWIPIFGETEATGTNALISGVSGRAWARKK
jgi:glycosidase